MISCRFTRIWCTKTKQIMQTPEMSVAEKLLAYKIFMRPLLMYKWFEGHSNSLKAMEVKFLKQVFGSSKISNLYKRYTDIDVTGYMKLEDIRWYRTSHSGKNVVRKTLYALSKAAADPSPYFTRATDRSNYRRHNESTESHSLLATMPAKRKYPASSSLTVSRRSPRLAIKDRNLQNNTQKPPTI